MKSNRSVQIILSMLFSFATAYAGAQSLSNYVIPVNKSAAYIGKVIPSTPLNKMKVKVVADTAHLFIVKNNELYLKKNVQLNVSSPMVYGIGLKINGTRVSFELIKDGFAKNKVIAHRGAWKHTGAAQNTIRSFVEACKMGCRGSEFDVWLTKDNVPILSHDPVIDGVTIEDATLDQIKAIQLPTGDKVPTLNEFLLEGKKQNSTYLILEIKPSQKGLERTLQLTDCVVDMVCQMKVQGWVEYISFSYEALQRVRQMDTAAKLSYLEGNVPVEKIKKDQLTGIDYSFYYFRSDPELIAKAQKLGLTTNVWTVDAGDDLKLYNTTSIDYITTNEPELLLQLQKQ